jgi:hypothetical protein
MRAPQRAVLPVPFVQSVRRVSARKASQLTLFVARMPPLYSFHRVAVRKTMISELLRLVLVCLNR